MLRQLNERYQPVKHPQKKIFLGHFSFSGVGPLCPVLKMINADKYIDIICKISYEIGKISQNLYKY